MTRKKTRAAAAGQPKRLHLTSVETTYEVFAPWSIEQRPSFRYGPVRCKVVPSRFKVLDMRQSPPRVLLEGDGSEPSIWEWDSLGLAVGPLGAPLTEQERERLWSGAPAAERAKAHLRAALDATEAARLHGHAIAAGAPLVRRIAEDHGRAR
jgi:hypothetical protein